MPRFVTVWLQIHSSSGIIFQTETIRVFEIGESDLTDFLNTIRHLIGKGNVRISEHGYDELAEDGLTVKELLDGIDKAQIVEEYPDYPKGRCILLLQKDKHGDPVHVLWGIPKGYDKPVVLVTCYRPDPKRWDQTFMHRIK